VWSVNLLFVLGKLTRACTTNSLMNPQVWQKKMEFGDFVPILFGEVIERCCPVRSQKISGF